MFKLDTPTIAAGTGAACAFVGGLALPIHSVVMDLIVSGGLAAAAGAGLYLVMPRSEAGTPRMGFPQRGDSAGAQVDALYAEIADQRGVDKAEVVTAIRMGEGKLRGIRGAAAEIRNPNVANRVRSICLTGDKILANFKVDPRDVRDARTWLNSYLDQTQDVVSNYASLSKNAAGRADVQRSLAKFDETLDAIDGMFKKQLERLLNNDAIDFDVNTQVFTSMIKQEGL